jgi:hypothetical protein
MRQIETSCHSVRSRADRQAQQLATAENGFIRFCALRRRAQVSREKDWIHISLTSPANSRIFGAAFRQSGSPHEIEFKASRGRYAQAHHPPLRLGGDRRLLLIRA